MSVDGTRLLFEGFLQKRKDNLKLRWVTYWFRLQNSTLFFYTERNCSASHLRGYYYIYTVQSVREVKKNERKRFMFEVIMTNGKRKMLAAETAALRKEWVRHLWQAMQLSTSGAWDCSFPELQACEQRDRPNSSTAVCSDSSSVLEFPSARPISAPPPSNHIHPEANSITSPFCPSEDQDWATYQNISLPSNDQSRHDQTFSDQQDGDYDVLPCRKDSCGPPPSIELDEDIYDCPRSYRSSEHGDPTDGIYDVPSCLLRTVDDDTIDEQSEEGIYWRI
ncbi:uncharacterized protein LOC133422028 isoform X2 [Cololabis saira]|uniref:uncharacterized protein LOC133422028 isoform X2 n=1 Tax=Cololabis saira TaxID=129043 RepID=UPI002AD413BE|nr:uncharacterized protein LOC133422028 isoform X2 [Cololabis saira]